MLAAQPWRSAQVHQLDNLAELYRVFSGLCREATLALIVDAPLSSTTTGGFMFKYLTQRLYEDKRAAAISAVIGVLLWLDFGSLYSTMLT